MKLQIYYPEKKNDLCYEVIKWKKKLLGHGRRMISFRFIEISKRASMNIEEFLTLAAKEEASDLFIVAGLPLTMKVME